MLITRRSMLTGEHRTIKLDITPEQLEAYENGGLVQHVFPHLSVDEREFFISGITPEEWDAAFGGDN